MAEKKKTRHGVPRVPRTDKEFDLYINSTTDHLLSPSTIPYEKRKIWTAEEVEKERKKKDGEQKKDNEG